MKTQKWHLRPVRSHCKYTALLAVALLCVVFFSCQRAPLVTTGDGSGTGVGNGAVRGMVIYPGGAPVKGAKVRLRPQYYLADTAGSTPASQKGLIDSSYTDSCGNFQIDSIVYGNSYCVEVNDYNQRAQATLYRFAIATMDSVVLTTRTVAPVAALSGTISVSGLPANAYIQIYGLERIGKTDSAGRYEIPNLPVGNCSENECEYKVRILIPNPGGGFTIKESEIEVTAGGKVQLDD
jgi:hypothetical protein